MSYATASALPAVNADATLLIDGIPILFGTRDGVAHAGTGTFGALTSVEAIVSGSLQFEKSSLNLDTLMVPPSGASLSIKIDSRWDKYFERRRTPSALLTSPVTAAGVTLTVSSSSGMDGLALYCNRETMLCTAEPTSTTATVTRNAYALPGYTASTHNTEAVVSASPRFLKGRLCELRLWVSDTDYRTLYLILANSPRYNRGTGQWELTFDSVMRRFDKQVAVGFQGSPVSSAIIAGSGTGTAGMIAVNLIPEVMREFAFCNSDDGCIFVENADGGGFIAPIIDRAADPTSTPIVDGGLAEPSTVMMEPPPVPVDVGAVFKNMRRCYILNGPPLLDLMKVLHSIQGDGGNGAYDVLFGVTSSGTTPSLEDGQAECRMGAAIMADFITAPSSELLAMRSPGWNRVLGANGPESLLDLMRDACMAAGVFAYTDSSGKLAFASLESAYSTDTYAATILDADIGEGTEAITLDDEDEVVHTVTLKCNWSPAENAFKGTVTMRDEETAETYRDSKGAITIERRGLVCHLPVNTQPLLGMQPPTSQMNFETLRVELDRYFAKRSPGIIKVNARLPWKFSTLVPGDLVRLTWEQFNSFAGGTLSARACLVVGVTPSVDFGGVDVELHVLRTAKPLAPTAVVTSWDGGTKTLTLNAAGKFLPGATPGRYFAAGWGVRIFDASTSPQYQVLGGATFTVASITDTTIVLTVSPGTAPAVGDLVTIADYDNATSTVTNTAQTLAQKDHAFQASATLTLGAALVAGDEWG